MTGASSGQTDELLRYADELRAWAAAVEAAAGAAASVVAALTTAWADARGRDWTERLRMVGVELADRAEEAESVARDAEHAAHGPGTRFPPLGVRLGGQDGARTTDRRGVVIPTFPPP